MSFWSIPTKMPGSQARTGRVARKFPLPPLLPLPLLPTRGGADATPLLPCRPLGVSDGLVGTNLAVDLLHHPLLPLLHPSPPPPPSSSSSSSSSSSFFFLSAAFKSQRTEVLSRPSPPASNSSERRGTPASGHRGAADNPCGSATSARSAGRDRELAVFCPRRASCATSDLASRL